MYLKESYIYVLCMFCIPVSSVHARLSGELLKARGKHWFALFGFHLQCSWPNLC